MRAFIALELPSDATVLLARIQAEMQRTIRQVGVRWIGEPQWHITLHFLGEISEAAAQQIGQGLTAMHASASPLSFWSLCGLYDEHQPTSLALKLADPTEGAHKLWKDLFPLILSASAKINTRPWLPHVTLARIRPQSAPFDEDLQRIHIPSCTFTPTKLRLYSSTMAPTGAVHTPIASCTLHV